ncbi:MAG: hypothetical protein HC778_07295 [Chamaesiphon sp. CSU_1_12]|nr:hypothetical protein [Chamaesiphon sp. CSU_1_12]
MSIANLDETTLRYNATDKSFQRGESYYQQGAVIDLCQRGNYLYGEVEGNEVEPYHITIQFDAGGVTKAECTCEYSFEGWCKHIVAVALTSIRKPETIHQRLSLNELLDRLNHVQTQTLVQELVAREPNLLDRIDRFVNKISPPIVRSISTTETTVTRPKTSDECRSSTLSLPNQTDDAKLFATLGRRLGRKSDRYRFTRDFRPSAGFY